MDACSSILNKVNKKPRIEKTAECGNDRISNLHESILSRILSFLPTKDAVRTSVLSSKWTYRWTTITNLHFDYSNPRGRLPSDDDEHQSFMNTVDKVLLVGCPSIDKFYVSIASSCRHDDSFHVHSWISAVIRRNVRNLHICYPDSLPLTLPHCLRRSDCLIHLDLRIPCTFGVRSPICFSTLRILQFEDVNILNEGFPRSSEISFSFPVLEELSLKKCSWWNVEVADFDTPKLNSFTFFDANVLKSKVVVKINGSSPKKFQRGGYGHVDTIFTCPSSVTKATMEIINAAMEWRAFRSGLGSWMGSFACNLLRQFSGLNHLTLTGEVVDALCYAEDFGGRTFIPLLQSFPSLESLTFSSVFGAVDIDEMVTEVAPRCFQTHLKVVRFEVLNGTEKELKLIKYFLKIAEVLEEMSLTAGELLKSAKSEREIEGLKEEILAFPRVSYNASIIFEGWCLARSLS